MFRTEGIVFTQSPQDSPDGYIVLDTQMTHAASGQYIISRLKMKVGKDDPQGYGSAITYARRYALGCMTGLVTEEDDDANAASPQPTTKNFAQKFPEQAKAIQKKLKQGDDVRSALTMNDLANIYDKQHPGASRPARTLKMETVTEWAEKRTDLFEVGDDDSFYLKQGNGMTPAGLTVADALDASASLLPGLDVGAYLLQFPKELKGQRVGDVTDVQLTWLAKYYNEKLSAPANAQSPYRQEWEAILKEVWAVQLHPSRLNQVPA
jgi:hypothetical protein